MRQKQAAEAKRQAPKKLGAAAEGGTYAVVPLLSGAGAAAQWAAASTWLSPAERREAQQLKASAAAPASARAQAFAVSRALRRRLLGQLVRCAPGALRFVDGPGMAPRLRQPYTHCAVSLSHSQGHVACAVSTAGSVGIDVESWPKQGPTPFTAERALRLARRFLSATEASYLLSVPPHLQAQIFLTLWAGKEALLKACGVGLRRAPAGFCLPLPPPHFSGWRGRVRWHEAPPAGALGLEIALQAPSCAWPSPQLSAGPYALALASDRRGASSIAATGGPWPWRRQQVDGVTLRLMGFRAK